MTSSAETLQYYRARARTRIEHTCAAAQHEKLKLRRLSGFDIPPLRILLKDAPVLRRSSGSTNVHPYCESSVRSSSFFADRPRISLRYGNVFTVPLCKDGLGSDEFDTPVNTAPVPRRRPAKYSRRAMLGGVLRELTTPLQGSSTARFVSSGSMYLFGTRPLHTVHTVHAAATASTPLLIRGSMLRVLPVVAVVWDNTERSDNTPEPARWGGVGWRSDEGHTYVRMYGWMDIDVYKSQLFRRILRVY